MIRSLSLSLLLFLVPFALYFLLLGLRRRQERQVAEGAGEEAEEVVSNPRHLLWVGLAGLVMAVSGFIYFTEFSGAEPDAVWVPPAYKDGQLVPGHFMPRNKAAP